MSIKVEERRFGAASERTSFPGFNAAGSLRSPDSRGGCPYVVLIAERSGFQPQRIAFGHVIERTSQAVMVVLLNRHEAERLQHAVSQRPRRTENFSHRMHWAGLRLERDFDKVSLAQALRQTQQASGHGNGLEFCFGAAAVLEADRSQDGIS